MSGRGVAVDVYDDAGNRVLETLGGGQAGFVYNGANRSMGIEYSTGALSTYAYAGEGLRGTLQDPGAPVTFTIWDGSDYLKKKS